MFHNYNTDVIHTIKEVHNNIMNADIATFLIGLLLVKKLTIDVMTVNTANNNNICCIIVCFSLLIYLKTLCPHIRWNSPTKMKINSSKTVVSSYLSFYLLE